ncbi:unnamed protein product [Tilletia caries]|uniref:RING-type domain-containing protein n=1 Tax=Tilletia caries TaxID=13290 RepID=A0ABN7IMC5_9BASI|nr:unnamed protein product [Tilletia caries]
MQHLNTGQHTLTGAEIALLQEHATLSALVSEIVGGVPPPIPQANAAGGAVPGAGAAAGASRPGASSRRPDGQRDIRAGTSIIVQGALYTRTARSAEPSVPAPAPAPAVPASAVFNRRPQRGAVAPVLPAGTSQTGGGRPASSSSPQQQQQQQPSHRLPPPGSFISSRIRTTRGGPTPADRAQMLNGLLRDAAAATAATIVARSEGLPPPAAAAPGPGGFGEFVGRHGFRAAPGARAGSGGSGSGSGGAGAEASPSSPSPTSVDPLSAGSSSVMPGQPGSTPYRNGTHAQNSTNTADTSTSSSSSTSTNASPSPSRSASLSNSLQGGLREMLHRHNHRRSARHHDHPAPPAPPQHRPMQRSTQSLDLLAGAGAGSSSHSRSGSSSLSSSSSSNVGSAAGGDAGGGGASSPGGGIGSWLDARLGRIRRGSAGSLPPAEFDRGDGASSSSPSSAAAAAAPSLRQRLASLTSRIRPSNVFMGPPASSSSSSSSPPLSASLFGPGSTVAVARERGEGRTDGAGALETMEAAVAARAAAMLEDMLRVPVPAGVPPVLQSQSQSRSSASLRTRSRARAEQEQERAGASASASASAAVDGGAEAGSGTAPGSSSAAGTAVPNTNSSPPQVPTPGVRVDIRDSAAFLSAFLDRARSGLLSGNRNGDGNGGAEGIPGSFESMLDTVTMDLEAAMVEMDLEQERVMRLEAAVRATARPARAGEGVVVDGAENMRLRRVLREGTRSENPRSTASSSGEADSSASTSERRRGDVHNAELSFFRVFCFPRANQAGVASPSAPTLPSDTPLPAGAASMGSGADFVLHPDLIPCVVVGVRSTTAADEVQEGREQEEGEGEQQQDVDAEGPPGGPGMWARRLSRWTRYPTRTSAAGSAGTTAAAAAAAADTEADGDVSMEDAPGSSEGEEDDDEAEEEEGGSARANTDTDVENGLPPRSWRFMIWVSGGFWPRSHPLLRAPPTSASRDLMLLIEFLTAMAGSSVPPPGDPNIHAPGIPPAPFPAGAGAGGAGGGFFPGGPMGLGGAMMELFGLMGNGHPPIPKATREELAESEETIVAKGWELASGLSPWEHKTEDGEGKSSERAAEKMRDVGSGAGDAAVDMGQKSLDDDDVRVLSCRHAFHLDCVDRWLCQSSNTCPMCRKAGVTKDTGLAAEERAARAATPVLGGVPMPSP